MIEFDEWYRRKIGIDVTTARSMGVVDLDLLEQAFEAGVEMAIADNKAEYRLGIRDGMEYAAKIAKEIEIEIFDHVGHPLMRTPAHKISNAISKAVQK